MYSRSQMIHTLTIRWCSLCSQVSSKFAPISSSSRFTIVQPSSYSLGWHRARWNAELDYPGGRRSTPGARPNFYPRPPGSRRL